MVHVMILHPKIWSNVKLSDGTIGFAIFDQVIPKIISKMNNLLTLCIIQSLYVDQKTVTIDMCIKN